MGADESETQHSILSLAASNVSEAYSQCLAWVGEFRLPRREDSDE